MTTDPPYANNMGIEMSPDSNDLLLANNSIETDDETQKDALVEHHGGSPNDPLHKQGIPIWTFYVAKVLFFVCPLDAYVMFPLLLLMIIAGLGALARIKDSGDFFFYSLMGICAAIAMSCWLQWARRLPRVPHPHDVAYMAISDTNNWPRAPVPPVRGELKAQGHWFTDDVGRRVLLRGINLASGSKLPATPESERTTHFNDDLDIFYHYQGVSFVGRPFPLEQANVHLGRLRAMGLTVMRFLVTWEAIEHDGPGVYDQEYLSYLKSMVQKCADYGLTVFIDAHQDVWSRWTGGDGAPAWTLEKVGFQLDKLHVSGAALTQQHCCADSEFPKMVWNSNNARLAAGTMWTLFFAGNDYAPRTMIDGEPVQHYLQRHFCAALAQVAAVLKDEPNVIGFDLLNEPSVGFVGVHDARDIGPNMFYVGWRVDPWTAIQLGAGKTCTVHYFSSFMVIDGKRQLNTDQECAWQNGPTSCVWYENGVWDLDPSTGQPRLLKPKYFATNPRTGHKPDFLNDYAIPFWKQAAQAVRDHIPDAIIFAEPVLDMTDPSVEEKPVMTADEVGAGYVWARHYYDGITLMTKSFSRYLGVDPVTQRPRIGMGAIQAAFAKGISKFKEEASELGPEGSPVLIGECGIPFDLGHPTKACGRQVEGTPWDEAAFVRCTRALNTTMRALEHAQVSFTLWTYEPDNTNEDGDGWNGEDLSLFSKDQIVPGDEDNLFAGGRSLLAAIRPYPCRVAGDVIEYSFRVYQADRPFKLTFKADHSLSTNETVIFLPKYQYPHGVDVIVAQGSGSYELDWETQTLIFRHYETSNINKIVVKKARHRPRHEAATEEIV